MAQVKPIIRISEAGTVEVPAKAMGMRKGMDQLSKRLEVQKPDLNHKIYVMYTAGRSIGQALAQKITAMRYEIPEEQIIPVGAVIGSHAGPGACGIAYVAE
jgi:fatty acid-binding protein DegV